MSRKQELIDGVIGSFSASFSLYPHEGTIPPASAQWADYLRQYPEYLETDYPVRGLVRHVLAHDRKLVEQSDLSPDHQRLMGTMILVAHSTEELIELVRAS